MGVGGVLFKYLNCVCIHEAVAKGNLKVQTWVVKSRRRKGVQRIRQGKVLNTPKVHGALHVRSRPEWTAQPAADRRSSAAGGPASELPAGCRDEVLAEHPAPEMGESYSLNDSSQFLRGNVKTANANGGATGGGCSTPSTEGLSG